ncbi:MAG TPA: transposase [Tepidisphaeraceae bacterium]|nr:transposase [Tepidisphaeraceae bacterium]
MRGQERKEATVVKRIGVDEKAFRKGHSYLTVVCDLDRATVEHVSEDRTIQSLSSYYTSLSPQQRDGIRTTNYRSAVRSSAPTCGAFLARFWWSLV